MSTTPAPQRANRGESPWKKLLAAGLAAVGVMAAAGEAKAQQSGYQADRILLGTNPDDGFATWRPVMGRKTRFFGSATAGYIRRPLRGDAIGLSPAADQRLGAGVITNQAALHLSAGAEILNRFGFTATLPVVLFNTSNNPLDATNDASAVQVENFAAGDLRLDLRGLFFKTDSEKFHVGGFGSLFLGTGNEKSFAGDGSSHGLVGVMLEERLGKLILSQNLGVHFRDRQQLDDLSFANEMFFSAAAFYPLRDGKVRLGGQVHGSTGLSKTVLRPSGAEGKSTFFNGLYTPVELLFEGRFALNQPKSLWLNVGAGPRISNGYSAPDFRVLAQIGYWFEVADTKAPSPGRRYVIQDDKLGEHEKDTDGDGFPDSVDKCITIPEDHKEPDPGDGCPGPQDRDKDGILDADDKCPDTPEDMDGIDDGDGCPEDDVDKDGIGDAKDACPREPGKPSKNPKKNGCPRFIKRIEGSNEIRILKVIEFDTARATIRPVSFPILDEVVALLKANADITKLSIEGHTDSRGAYQMNKKLSEDRAASVRKYLITKGGIKAERLTSKGFGPDKPIADNKTVKGRAKNRRVEFHIVDEE